MFPMHCGTFDLTDEPPGEAPRALRRQLPRMGVDAREVALLAVGETRRLAPRSSSP